MNIYGKLWRFLQLGSSLFIVVCSPYKLSNGLIPNSTIKKHLPIWWPSFVFIFCLLCFCPSYLITQWQHRGINRCPESVTVSCKSASATVVLEQSHLRTLTDSSGLHFNFNTELYLTCPGLSLSHDPSVCSRDQHVHLRLCRRISLFIFTLMDMLEQSLDSTR